MPVSRSFNKKKNRKKPSPTTAQPHEKASLNQQAATAANSATSPSPITVEVNGQEIVVDDELIIALGGTIRADEVSIASGNVKMSEVLIEFVEPTFALADENYRRAFLTMAVTAWNGALLPAETRGEVKFGDIEGGEWLRELMAALISRKQEVYADNNWMVADYKILGSGAEARIEVISTVLLPQLVSK